MIVILIVLGYLVGAFATVALCAALNARLGWFVGNDEKLDGSGIGLLSIFFVVTLWFLFGILLFRAVRLRTLKQMEEAKLPSAKVSRRKTDGCGE